MKYLLLILLFSCTTTPPSSSPLPVAGSCENEFQKTKLSTGESLWQNVVQSASSSASYLVTGLGHSSDVIVTYGGGTIVTLTICSPLLLIDGVANHHNASSRAHASTECLQHVGGKVYQGIAPGLGDKAKEMTESWRCPEIDHIAEGLLLVADCYRKNGDTASATSQIDRIRESRPFMHCLSKSLRKKISSMK
jgi:hypothetical protein